LIKHGADLEALDTYGMTPLHRMASNNLPVGAKALLDAGADPHNTGLIGKTPYQIAQESRANGVMRVLSTERRTVDIDHVQVDFPTIADFENFKGDTTGRLLTSLTGKFSRQDPATIPDGFDSVCRSNGWNTEGTWNKLNGNASWFAHDNGSYIYFNKADGKWWLDAPDGMGVFVAGPSGVTSHAVPSHGWALLQRDLFDDLFGAAVDAAGEQPVPFVPMPVVRSFRSVKNIEV
jgi:hypothetical protein